MASVTDDKLFNYLDRVGLSDYFNQFKKCGIGMDNITTMTIQDYSRVGITNKQDRKKLFELIQVVKRNKANEEIYEPRMCCMSR